MNPNTSHHVQSIWAQVLPIAPQAAAIFCDELFTLDPPLRSLFKGDMQAQGTRLMQMIGAAVGQLKRLGALVPVAGAAGPGPAARWLRRRPGSLHAGGYDIAGHTAEGARAISTSSSKSLAAYLRAKGAAGAR